MGLGKLLNKHRGKKLQEITGPWRKDKHVPVQDYNKGQKIAYKMLATDPLNEQAKNFIKILKYDIPQYVKQLNENAEDPKVLRAYGHACLDIGMSSNGLHALAEARKYENEQLKQEIEKDIEKESATIQGPSLFDDIENNSRANFNEFCTMNSIFLNNSDNVILKYNENPSLLEKITE